MSVAVRVETDTASPWLKDLQGRVTSHRIASEVGPRCTRLVQRNFRSLGENARGWPTTHFYGRAAEATNWQEGFGFLNIVVNQIGVRQRLEGGPIKPVNAGALTIPAREEAYGKTASEFPNLKFGFALDPERGTMRPALIGMASQGSMVEQRTYKSGKKKGQTYMKEVGQIVGLEAMFWLSKGVNQKPDPRVLPSDEEFFVEFDRSVGALMRDNGNTEN